MGGWRRENRNFRKSTVSFPNRSFSVFSVYIYISVIEDVSLPSKYRLVYTIGNAGQHTPFAAPKIVGTVNTVPSRRIEKSGVPMYTRRTPSSSRIIHREQSARNRRQRLTGSTRFTRTRASHFVRPKSPETNTSRVCTRHRHHRTGYEFRKTRQRTSARKFPDTSKTSLVRCFDERNNLRGGREHGVVVSRPTVHRASIDFDILRRIRYIQYIIYVTFARHSSRAISVSRTLFITYHHFDRPFYNISDYTISSTMYVSRERNAASRTHARAS